MKNTQKKFLSAVLAASSVAGVVAPAVTAFAATATEVETLVANALKDRTFFSFNKAYEGIISLPAADQGKYLDKIAALGTEVRTAKIDTILKKIEEFYKTESVATYDEIYYKLIPEVPAQIDRDYLSYELYKYGKPFYETKVPDYPKATDAIIAVDTALQAGKYADAQALVPAAEAAIAKVTSAVNNTYLKATLAEVVGRLDAASPLKVSSLTAVGEKKLKVTFNKPVSDASKLALTVKRDNITLTVANTEWNASKTEATLTMSYNLQDGKYVAVSVYDSGAETKTSEVEVKAAKLDKIIFTNPNAVIYNGDATNTSTKDGLKAKVKFENQYGEDITKNITNSNVNISVSNGDTKSLSNGEITITKGTGEFAVDSKVVVTVVHSSGVVGTATLTAVQSAQIKTIEIGELTTDVADLKGKPVYQSTIANNAADFYLPVKAIDQYGNELTAAELNAAIPTGNILVSNSNILNINTTTRFTTKNDKPALVLATATSPATSGTVVLTLVDGAGATGSKTLEVKANAKIDTLNFVQPNDILKQTVATKIPFTSLNQYGTELVNSTDLPTPTQVSASELQFSDNTKVSVTNGTIAYKIDYANSKKVYFEVTPSATATNVVITTITATNKVQTLTIGVEKEPVPVSIGSIKSDFYKLLQKGQTQTISTSLLVFKDQYGKDKSLPSGYSFNIIDPDTTNTNVTYAAPVAAVADDPATTVDETVAAVPGTFTASSTAKGTKVFKLQLLQGTTVKDELEFTMESVDLADVTSFTVNDLKKHWTGDKDSAGNVLTTETAHDQTIAISGLKGTAKVKVAQSLIKSTYITNGLNITGTTTLQSSYVKTEGADKTATLSVIVQGAETPVTLTKEVTYNDAAPKAQSLIIKNGSSEVTDPVIGLATSAVDMDVVNTTTGFRFILKDQYGIDSSDVSLVITNVKEADTDNNFSVSATGEVIDVVNGEAGDTFVITAITSTGLSKTIKVVLNQ